jgi:hypothetical protein
MLLFNPVCVLAPIDDLNSWPTDQAKMNRRMGGDNASVLSPAHHVSTSSAPCVLFHGTADTALPYATAEKFAENMNAAGARCKLVGDPLSTFLGEAHPFGICDLELEVIWRLELAPASSRAG